MALTTTGIFLKCNKVKSNRPEYIAQIYITRDSIISGNFCLTGAHVGVLMQNKTLTGITGKEFESPYSALLPKMLFFKCKTLSPSLLKIP